MIEEELLLGGLIYAYFEELNENVAVVISSDLAYTHKANLKPWGFFKHTEELEMFMSLYVKRNDKIYLIDEAKKVFDHTKSCGWSGMVLL